MHDPRAWGSGLVFSRCLPLCCQPSFCVFAYNPYLYLALLFSRAHPAYIFPFTLFSLCSGSSFFPTAAAHSHPSHVTHSWVQCACMYGQWWYAFSMTIYKHTMIEMASNLHLWILLWLCPIIWVGPTGLSQSYPRIKFHPKLTKQGILATGPGAMNLYGTAVYF